MNFKGIIILLISTVLFDILFIQLKNSNPQALSIFDKIPERWKGKWYIKWTFIILLLLVLSSIQVLVKLNDLVGYTMAGFILSVCNLALKKPEEKGKKSKKKSK
ncbi:MAG: hypothetical protein GX053_07595 [Tissierella sp.]|nr:hypothetical protein [Tissierella sp.]